MQDTLPQIVKIEFIRLRQNVMVASSFAVKKLKEITAQAVHKVTENNQRLLLNPVYSSSRSNSRTVPTTCAGQGSAETGPRSGKTEKLED